MGLSPLWDPEVRTVAPKNRLDTCRNQFARYLHICLHNKQRNLSSLFIRLHRTSMRRTRQLDFLLSYYRPKRSFGQGNIFTPVCHSVHREGGSGKENPPRPDTPPNGEPPWTRPDTPPDGEPPPQTRHPPDGEPPPRPDQTPSLMENPPPGWRTPHPHGMENPPGGRLRHTVYDRPVRILLECILVRLCYPTNRN